jgi:hypothetical protein
MHWRVLELYIQVLGAEHPSTLRSMNNLALVLDSQGKYAEAEQMRRRALQPREEVHHSSASRHDKQPYIGTPEQSKYSEAKAKSTCRCLIV